MVRLKNIFAGTHSRPQPTNASTPTGTAPQAPASAHQAAPPSGLISLNKARVHAESGAAIRKVKQDVGWTAASGFKEKAKHRFNAVIGQRPGRDKMADFVHAVVDDPRSKVVAKRDPVDDRYLHYSAPAGAAGKRAHLSISPPDTSGADPANVHISAFTHRLANNPGLEQAIREMKERGWTLRYDTHDSFDTTIRAVTIALGDAKQAEEALSQALSTHVFADGTRNTMTTVESAFHHLYKQPSVLRFGLAAFAENPWAPKGIYNAICRNLDAEASHPNKLGSFDPAKLPGVDKHDAAMVLAYRGMFAPLNATLRSGDSARTAKVTDLAASIDKSLAKFPTHKGLVFRRLGGRDPAHGFAPVPAADIERYEKKINQTIVEPAYVSATADESKLTQESYASGNVTMYIFSETGKDLATLSPHAEILLPRNREYEVMDVRYLDNSRGTAFPTAEIFLYEVDPAKATELPPAVPAGASTSGTA